MSTTELAAEALTRRTACSASPPLTPSAQHRKSRTYGSSSEPSGGSPTSTAKREPPPRLAGSVTAWAAAVGAPAGAPTALAWTFSFAASLNETYGTLDSGIFTAFTYLRGSCSNDRVTRP
eukprot:scaffold10_cov257-Pinguiococcus_pyrenoidosus.AAC.67